MITKNHHVSEHDKIEKSQLITSTKQPSWWQNHTKADTKHG